MRTGLKLGKVTLLLLLSTVQVIPNMLRPLLFIVFVHGGIVVVIAWKLDIPEQSVHITTNVVSSKTPHCEVYSIQHYVIKFISDLRQVGDFLEVLRLPPPIKLK